MMEENAARLLETLGPLLASTDMQDEATTGYIRRVLAELLQDICRAEINSALSTEPEREQPQLSPGKRLTDTAALRISHQDFSENIKKLETQLIQAKAEKTRQQAMYREIIQKLAKESRQLRSKLAATEASHEETKKLVIVRDNGIRQIQLDLSAAQVESKHLKIALSQVNARIAEAVDRERSEWQRSSRYNSGQVRSVRDQNDLLRQQLFKERDQYGRALSPPKLPRDVDTLEGSHTFYSFQALEGAPGSSASYDFHAPSASSIEVIEDRKTPWLMPTQSITPVGSVEFKSRKDMSDEGAVRRGHEDAHDRVDGDLEAELAHVRGNYEALKAEFEQAQSEAEGMLHAMSGIQSRVMLLTGENQTLRGALETERGRAEELQHTLATKEEQVDSQEEKLQQLQRSNHDLWVQCNEFLAMKDNLDRVLLQESAPSEDQQLREEIQRRERVYQEDTDALQAIIKSLEEELHAQSAETDDLRGALVAAQAVLLKETARADESAVEVKETQSRHEDLEMRYNYAMEAARMEVFEQQVLHDNSYGELQAQYEQLREEFAAYEGLMQEELERAQRQQETSDAELAQLRESLQLKEAAAGTVADIHSDFKTYLKEKADLATLSEELLAWRQQLQNDRDDFEDEVRQWQLLSSAERDDAESKQCELLETTQEVERLREDVKDLCRLEEFAAENWCPDELLDALRDYIAQQESVLGRHVDVLNHVIVPIEVYRLLADSLPTSAVTQEHPEQGLAPTARMDIPTKELVVRLNHAEARAEALTRQLESMPSSLQLAQAEKRVLETRLQQLSRTAEATLRSKLQEKENILRENEAFIELQKKEKTELRMKFSEQAQTVHQLTLHVQLLLAQQKREEDMLRLPPPPWAAEALL